MNVSLSIALIFQNTRGPRGVTSSINFKVSDLATYFRVRDGVHLHAFVEAGEQDVAIWSFQVQNATEVFALDLTHELSVHFSGGRVEELVGALDVESGVFEQVLPQLLDLGLTFEKLFPKSAVKGARGF